MSFGVFIIPKGTTNDLIIKDKNNIDNLFPNHPYTRHPPHATLYHFESNDKCTVLQRFNKFCFKNNSINIELLKPSVFWDDLQTEGHTIIYKIKKNERLFSLQRSVANTFKGLPILNENQDYLYKDKRQLKSFANYGYPFVGSHWIPHFSISSLKIEKDNDIFRKHLSQNIILRLKITKISLWEIKDNDHIMISEIPLCQEK